MLDKWVTEWTREWLNLLVAPNTVIQLSLYTSVLLEIKNLLSGVNKGSHNLAEAGEKY